MSFGSAGTIGSRARHAHPRPVLFAVPGLFLVLLLAACPASPGTSPTPRPVTAEPTEEATDGPEATEEPEATEAPDEPVGAEEAMDILLGFVPGGIVESCEPSNIRSADTLAEIECELEGAGADWVAYSLYANLDDMDAHFDGWISSLDLDEEASCEDGPGAVGPYSISGEEVGRVVCTEISGEAWMKWTDERLMVVASAMRSDGDHAALYEWWTGDSGPNP